MNVFDTCVEEASGRRLSAVDIETLQVNLGFCCNQACAHCHVEASPDRTEIMDWPVMELVLEAAGKLDNPLLDLTGGAPEMNPHFRRFTDALADRGMAMQVRTNLTVLADPRHAALPEFCRDRGVRLTASLPCYLEGNVDFQRGAGTYDESIRIIRRLNAIGYGVDAALPLDLVYNPGGATLPPSQSALEEDYRRELDARHGISFTHLITITNMPIGRFGKTLRARGEDGKYARLLRQSFNPATIDGLMCRHQVSVGWDGALYDCDFNLVLGMPVEGGIPAHVRDFDPVLLASRSIITGEHCLACTAGAGSSCRGALA